jgi:hypothetical protein
MLTRLRLRVNIFMLLPFYIRSQLFFWFLKQIYSNITVRAIFFMIYFDLHSLNIDWEMKKLLPLLKILIILQC